MAWPAACRITCFEGYVVKRVPGEVAAPERGQLRAYFHRMDMQRSVGKKRREISAARTDLEYPVGFFQREFLHDARFHFRRHHELVRPAALADWDFHVAEGEAPISQRNEILARHGIE